MIKGNDTSPTMLCIRDTSFGCVLYDVHFPACVWPAPRPIYPKTAPQHDTLSHGPSVFRLHRGKGRHTMPPLPPECQQASCPLETVYSGSSAPTPSDWPCPTAPPTSEICGRHDLALMTPHLAYHNDTTCLCERCHLPPELAVAPAVAAVGAVAVAPAVVAVLLAVAHTPVEPAVATVPPAIVIVVVVVTATGPTPAVPALLVLRPLLHRGTCSLDRLATLTCNGRKRRGDERRVSLQRSCERRD
jgi:hypothetical protein